MSEQFSRRPADEHGNSHMDDPLAELARIVTEDESGTESSSTHHASTTAREQNSNRQSKPSGLSSPSIMSSLPRADKDISPELKDNPFAKFVVKPVDIPEGPRKVEEKRAQVSNARTQETRSRANPTPAKDTSARLLAEAPPRAEVTAEVDEDIPDPFADIDLELTDMLEGELAEEEVTNMVEQAEGDGLDLETQLMAELNGEEEFHIPQYVKKPEPENKVAPQNQASPQQDENLPEDSQQQTANSDPLAEADQVDDPETTEFLEAFAAERIQVSDQDFEANLEQSIGLIDDKPVKSDQKAAAAPSRNSVVQSKIDAVLSSLDRPSSTAQNVNAAMEQGNGHAQQPSTATASQNANDVAVNNSMAQMSSVLASSQNTHTELPEFPEPRQYLNQDVNQAPDTDSEPQPGDPHLFYNEPDYSEDERQINESVHALQDDLAAQSMEIESAFTDAFAEELSQDMDMQSPDNQAAQAQMAYEQQQPDMQTAQNQDYQDYQNYPPDHGYTDGYSEEYADDYHHQTHAADYNNAEMDAIDYRQLEQPLSQAQQNELEIDQALVGALMPQKKKSSGFKMAAIALGGAVAIGAGVVGYGLIGNNSSNGDPVLVRADQSDFKVKPDQPGGREIANQDQPVYVSMNGKKTVADSQEKLVSSNVKPVDLESGNESDNLSKSSERLSNSKANANQNAANAFIQPRKVKTVIVRADGTIITSQGTKVADLGAVPADELSAARSPVDQNNSVDGAVGTNIIPVPTANPFVAKNPVSANQVRVADPNKLVTNSNAAATPVNTLTTAAEQEVQSQVVKTVAVSPQQVRTTALDNRINNALATNPGAYKVQISSQRSQEAAEATYQNLKQKFPDLLNGQPREIRAVNVEDKGTFYRVQIPVGDMPEAANFCKRYKAAGGSCFVTR